MSDAISPTPVASGEGGEGFSGSGFRDAYAAAGAEFGRVNIAVFGKTGVGKSTLINAIFGEDVAETGQGSPVTTESRLYIHRAGHVGIIDNQGLEIGQDSESILRDLTNFIDEQREKELSEQLHLAWYCVHAGHRRFEQFEVEFIRRLEELGIPVLVVLTQVPRTQAGVHPQAVEFSELVRELCHPKAHASPILTAARGDEHLSLIAFGLDDLLDATFLVAPEGVAAALTAAQKIDFKRKDEATNKAIAAAVALAAGTGASPIPFSDAALLVPIQVAMVGRIAHIYGLDLETASAAAVVATTAATALGKTVVTGLLKMVPGFGTVVGGAISATVAAGLTFGMGAAWQAVCIKVAKGELNPEVLGDQQRIAAIFIQEFKRSATRQRPPVTP